MSVLDAREARINGAHHRRSWRAPVSVPVGRILFYASAVAVVLFCVRVLGDPWDTRFPKVFPDSFSYDKVATKGPFHPSFLWDERPIGYPLFLWAVGRSTQLNAVALTLAYCASFALLFTAALRAFASRVAQSVAIFLLLLVAVQGRFALWAVQVLSESLALSTGTVMIAAWLWFASAPTARRVTWAWIATAAFVLVRDSHVVPVVLVILPLALVFGLSKRAPADLRRRLLGGAGAILVLCAYVYVAQDVSNRNQYPFHNNVGLRILPDEDLTQWFVQGGMPLDDTLRNRSGHVTWDDGEAFLRDPALAEYRDWADGEGGRRFLLSMVLRSPDWLERMGDELPGLLADDQRGYDVDYHVADRLPERPLGALSGPDSNGSLRVWTHLALFGVALSVAAGLGANRRNPAALAVIGGVAVATIAAEFMLSGTFGVLAPIAVFVGMIGYFAGAGGLRHGRSLRFGLFGLAGIAFAYIELYSSYVGDAVEVSRHFVGPLERLAVVSVLCVGIGIEAFARILSTAPTASTPAPDPEPEPVPA